MKGDLFVGNIGELATPLGFAGLKGPAMKEIRVVLRAAVLCKGGKIVFAGSEEELRADPRLAEEAASVPFLDAGGKACIPGFVDSHTHFCFAGYREDEFTWRARGLSYMEIHEKGGGIRRTTEATRAADRAGLLSLGAARLSSMLSLGITTVEGKSGYGLDFDTEMRQLEVMAELGESSPVRIVPTFMGLHSIPGEYAGRAGDYVDFVIGRVLPEVRRRGLARFVDVFCEKGVFGLEESRRFLEAARAAGFGLKLHADEIVRIGGAGLAAELGATSADHLLKADGADLRRMAEAGVVATCLPLTAFVLREPYAPARTMIDMGLCVALASDLNPGSCYSQSIPLIFALAVLQMGLGVEEALAALTLNGAAALGLAGETGSLEAGKRADMVLLDAPSYRHLAYHVGMNLVETVVCAGEPHTARGLAPVDL